MKHSIICLIILLVCSPLFTSSQDAVGGFEKKFETNDTAPAKTNDLPVDVSFNFLDAPLMDIMWCGPNKSTIFVLTEKATLYRSVDDGFSGHKLTDHFEKLGKKELEGTESQVGQVSRMIPSPVDPSLILFLGTEGINWITENCGESVKAMNQGRKVEEIQFHPTERTWMLAYAWTICDDFKDEPCRRYKELFFTKDLGDSWEYLANYVYQFSWAMFDATAYKIPKERIFIAHEPRGKGHQSLSEWSERLYISYSDDFFNSSKILVKGGNKFLLSANFLFIVQVTNEDEDEVVLLVGSSREKNYKHLHPIDLPIKHLREHSYTILDTSEHAVFLHINHDGENSRYGNIYVSDSTGSRFNLALSGNVRNLDGQCDFERVQGVEGIYLANVYDKDQLKTHKNTNYDSFTQGPGSKKTSDPMDYAQKVNVKTGNNYGQMSFREALNDFKQTVISFDKGGMWKHLTPPERDVDGKRVRCDELNCHLHLHSISDPDYGPFYSTSNSMGLILGTGNIGEYLSNNADEINTYLSRDGGLTWFEIAKGSHIYEIGDHGSIIVMAPDQHATTEVIYSWNEGMTWETIKISEYPVEVRNIIIEPSNTAEKFIIYGRTTDTPRKGFLAAVDFTPLHKRWCKGIENPGAPDSDYELWTPNGFVSSHCLLGRKVTYLRKKREAECFNSEEHETWNFKEFCDCTEEDWECDFGYYRKDLASPCVSSDGKEANYTAPAECDGHYFVTQGYRKIAGDTCRNGINHEPIQISCPGVSGLSGSNLLVFLTLVLIILGLVWMSKKGNYERLRESVSEFTGGLFKSIRGNALHKPGSGWIPINEVPDTAKGEEDFQGIVFEENEEKAEVMEDNNLLEVAKGKKRTEGRGLDAASKRVPILNKPGGKDSEFDPSI